jgi:hypothetical protein
MHFFAVTLVFNRKLKGHSNTFRHVRVTTVSARVSLDGGEIGNPNPNCNADTAVKMIMEENAISTEDLIEVHAAPCGLG